MQVHNFYVDILLSLTYYLNKITNNVIKSYQYNLGNRSFNLTYSPNFELPSAYITYNNSSHVNPNIQGFLKTFSNYNQIDVLYNQTKNLKLVLQEDYFNIDVDIAINTDSQFQAIDIKHNIETTIPIGKPLQVYHFLSFYELDNNYINEYLFNPISDNIYNLFYKHNRLLNKFGYYFSVDYEPLITLESIGFDSLDINQSIYSLNLSLNIKNHLPIKLLFEASLQSQRIALTSNKINEYRTLYHNDVKVVINKKDSIFVAAKVKNKDHKIINLNLRCDKKTAIGNYNNNNLNFDFEVFVNKEVEEGHINTLEIENADIIIYKGLLDNHYGYISGPTISGKLKNIELKNNIICSMDFNGHYKNQILEDESFENIEYLNKKSYYLFTNLKIDNSDIFVLDYHNINTLSNIFEFLNYVSVPQSEINLKLTKIKHVTYFDENNVIKVIDLFNKNILEESQGKFELITNTNKKIIGYINKQTSEIEIQYSDLDIFEIVFDVVLKVFPVRGPGKVQKLSVNVNVEDTSVISQTIPNISNSKYNVVIEDLDNNLDEESNRYLIDIQLPFYNKTIPDKYEFILSYNNTKINQDNINIILDTEKSISTKLSFSITKGFYETYFKTVSKIYPLFFLI